MPDEFTYQQRRRAQEPIELQAEADFQMKFTCLLAAYAEEPDPDPDLVSAFESLRPQIRTIYRCLKVRRWELTLTE
jgi:hypothetical protein